MHRRQRLQTAHPTCTGLQLRCFLFRQARFRTGYDVHALHGCRIGVPAQVVDGILGHLLRQGAKINIRPRFNNDGAR